MSSQGGQRQLKITPWEEGKWCERNETILTAFEPLSIMEPDDLTAQDTEDGYEHVGHPVQIEKIGC